jgi:hypothetical protein
LALFDTLNDETNSSQIGGGFDGVGLVVEMGRSLPWYFGTGPLSLFVWNWATSIRPKKLLLRSFDPRTKGYAS